MKTKLEMAHEWYMKHSKSPSFMNTEVGMAWDYVDAMQAEVDKRKNIQTQETECNHEPYGSVDGCDRYICKKCNKVINVETNSCVEKEWQPDWSQAPEWANFIVMSKAGTSYWHTNEPKASGNGWVGGGLCDLAYMDFYHKGDWRESLRKRPQ